MFLFIFGGVIAEFLKKSGSMVYQANFALRAPYFKFSWKPENSVSGNLKVVFWLPSEG